MYRRYLLPCLLLLLAAYPATRALVIGVLSDAFLQVAAFVGATLTLYYGLTHSLGQQRLVQLIGGHPLYGVLSAACLGALPGCGGAIIVITQFTKGHIRFGAVVAVLTSTMGDAAFLLLAQRPTDGLLIIALGCITGTLSGYLVSAIHRPDFMRPAPQQADDPDNDVLNMLQANPVVAKASFHFWRLLMLPTLLLGIALALQWDINALFGLADGSLELVAALAGFIAVLLWALSSTGGSYLAVTCEDNPTKPIHWLYKVALDTQFVTSWVVAAFLLFELAMFFSGFDLRTFLASWGSWAVLMAVVIGFMPGCGPQILVTGLYLQGALPFSAQLGNAISNDGDALFPAIALAPKAAILATLYSAIPAILLGYGYHFLFE